MFNESGYSIFNGITDEELVKIIEIKEKHEASLDFQPSVMQPREQNTPDGTKKKFYLNARFDWRTADGAKAMLEIFQVLSPDHHE